MKASELILGVVADSRKLDRETYVPRADDWHSPVFTGFNITPGKCEICFAGAWLTRHFRPEQYVQIHELKPALSHTCLFLDRIRIGEFSFIRRYAEGAGIEQPVKLESFLQSLLTTTPRIWKQDGFPVGDFHAWDGFEKFLGEMDILGGTLKQWGF